MPVPSTTASHSSANAERQSSMSGCVRGYLVKTLRDAMSWTDGWSTSSLGIDR